MVDEDEGLFVDPDPEEDDEESAFPAPAQTPGQVDSRMAHRMLTARHTQVPWWQEYLALRAAGWDWRKAAYIAWMAVPLDKRIPPTLEELAQDVLGLRSGRTVRKWRERDPNIDAAIEKARTAILGERLPDVINAWVEVAALKDPAAHRDRLTYLETMGIYRAQASLKLSGEKDSPPVQMRVERESEFADWSDDELEQLIANLQAATGVLGGGAA